MEQIATVVDNSQLGKVTVEVELKSACSHCSNEDSCGTKAISKAFPQKFQRLSLSSNKSYSIGDSVKLGIAESVLLKSAALIYLFPLIGLFIGAFVAQILGANLAFGSDLIMMLSSISSAVLFWLLAKKLAKKLETSAEPVILTKLGGKMIS